MKLVSRRSLASVTCHVFSTSQRSRLVVAGEMKKSLFDSNSAWVRKSSFRSTTSSLLPSLQRRYIQNRTNVPLCATTVLHGKGLRSTTWHLNFLESDHIASSILSLSLSSLSQFRLSANHHHRRHKHLSASAIVLFFVPTRRPCWHLFNVPSHPAESLRGASDQ
jgi:hypothetical protein